MMTIINIDRGLKDPVEIIIEPNQTGSLVVNASIRGQRVVSEKCLSLPTGHNEISTISIVISCVLNLLIQNKIE